MRKLFQILALVAFASLPAFAAEKAVTFRGQTIWVDGDPIIAAGDDRDPAVDGELVLVYTNTDAAAANTLRTEAKIEMRALLVGGGGAGGYGTTGSTNPGGGGGGGEVKEIAGAEYAAGTFAAIVGAGGAQKTSAGNGENGHPSSISLGGTEIDKALGGGGGGAKKVGSGGDTVATGGGGGGKGNAGGEGALGSDHKGGAANYNNRSGGGGGAGGPGEDSHLLDPSNPDSDKKAGDGGVGVSSDIWLDGDKNPRVFGGGGGGAQSTDDSTAWMGSGKDGGGNGGRQNNAPDPGTPNTGGGGGGGGRGSTTVVSPAYGAAGGSGIVIIRITYIEVPMVWTEIPISAGGNAGKIFVDQNAAWTRVNPSDLSSDIIIAYSNVTARGGLRFFDPDDTTLPPVWANARILAVGGGGGGGCVNIQRRGGGAGGGAGGYLEESGFVFDNSVEYSIAVGAGGQAGEGLDDTGKNGKGSSVTTNGVLLMSREAAGGGGGGARCAGLDGASGGGGSLDVNVVQQPGGTGIEGLGFAGGRGEGGFVGGGGGGAGGAGGNGIDYFAGAGGVGKKSNITGTDIWYAGGGGGAYVNPNDGSSKKYVGGEGGLGGGGHGAGNKVAPGPAFDPQAAEDGADGLGGGGGGGSSHEDATTPGGKGGNGVVIIRLSGFVVKNIPLPVPQNFTYDGLSHTGVVEFFAYTLTGTPIAKNSDVYSVTATIPEGKPYEWADAEKTGQKWGPRTVTWHINQLEVEVPGSSKSFVYNGKEQTPVDLVKYDVDGDGVAHVTPASSGLRLPYCQLFEYKKTDAGNYTVTGKLVRVEFGGTQATTNFIWKLTSKMDDYTYPWWITKAPNAIVGFYYDGYSLARIKSAHHPSNHYTCDWGKDTAVYEYRSVTNETTYGEWTEWGTGPTEKGNYEVRVTIPETPNWQGDQQTLPFGAWEKLSDIFGDQMKVTVSGNSSGTTVLKNFPVPVKFYEPDNDGYSAMSGFSFLRAGADGTTIHFFDTNGDPIPHDVERWNTRSKADSPSVVWVRVPELSGTTKFVTAGWKRVSDIRLPPYDGTAVWRDNYAGVWHMSQLTDGKIADATGGGLNATLTGSRPEYEFIDAKLGKGLYLKTGDLIVNEYESHLPTNTAPFAYSAWFLGKDYRTGGTKGQGPCNHYVFAGKKDPYVTNPEQGATGWCMTMNNNATYYLPYSSGNTNFGNKTILDIRSNWSFLGFKAPVVGTLSTLYCEYNNANTTAGFQDVASSSKTVHPNALPLYLVRQGFAIDEARLAKTNTAMTTAWMKNEYESLRNANFCTYDLVQIDCDQYNAGAGLKCDWWTSVPAMAKTVWKTNETVQLSQGGAYKSGAYRTIVYTNMLGGAASSDVPKTNGYYRVIVDHTNPTPYRPQAYMIDFYIIDGTDPSHDLGEPGGASGRILLMNADNNTAFAVTNQGWCVNEKGKASVTWWKMLAGTAEDGRDNVMGGTSFELNRVRDDTTLWRLYNCRQGNTFPTNDTLFSGQIYLPASSSTALAITNETVAATRGSTGWLMMRNTIDAAVYSPCYTNGIGTIYFDAVNSTNAVGSAFELVLEIATQTTEGLPPVDSNCWVETSLGTTNWYGRISDELWKPVAMTASRVQNGKLSSDLDPTNRLPLAETMGGSTKYFYRVHVPVNIHTPIRFRLRRVTEDTTAGGATQADYLDASYLLLDNLIVSKPPVTATLKPYCENAFDTSIPGNAAVGVGGAFATPFPAPSDLPLTARCRVELPVGAEETAKKDPKEYIDLAQMFYRWRYLGQIATTASSDANGWTALPLTGAGAGAMKSEQTLELLKSAGDVEFYFLSIMKSPFYGYTDYTGLNQGVSKKGYTEENLKRESHYEKKVPRLASGGNEWFTRIREAKSDYEQMKVVLSGAVTGEFPMKLHEDNVWRTAVQIPTNVEGKCTFSFMGLNRQTAGLTEYAANTNTWGVTAGQGEITLPGNGVLSEGGEPGVFTIDHIANYVEFRIRSDANPTWSASRAEYQNFNNWNDVWSSSDDLTFTVGTNGVDDVAMRKETADMSDWDLYQSEYSGWNETFNLANFNDPGYPKETYFPNHPTPADWAGTCITFVSKNLDKWVDPGAVDNVSGMAAKLAGGGSGTMDFLKANGPKGLETVTFTARLGQSLTFDAINYSSGNTKKKNYLFLAPASMSRAIADNTQAGDMSVGGAVSLYAYYRESKGCYEFRVTRAASGAELLMELFKWHVVNGAMTATRLCGQRQFYDTGKKTGDTFVLWNDSGEINPKFYGFFISVKTDDANKCVEICGGVGKDAQAPTSSFSGTDGAPNGYGGLWFKDTADDRLVSGSYGVAAKDCPAQFLVMRHFDAPLGQSVSYAGDTTTYKPATAGTGKYFLASANKNFTLSGLSSTQEWDDIQDGWWELNGQMEPYVNKSTSATAITHHGLRTPVDKAQDVLVQLQPKAGGTWTTVDRKSVSGYALQSFTSPLYRSGDWNLRLTTSSNAMDVVIGEVHQVQWQGVDHEGINNGADLFVYTQGAVFSNVTRRVNETVLQPARGVATKAMSVRSPILAGLGKISFAYEDADSAAELWVQVATNKVSDNLTGTGGYNYSIESVEKGQQAQIGEWITVAKYGAGEDCDEPLSESGVKTVYLGWHDGTMVPRERGVFRVFVPPSVVEKAIVAATNATKNAAYGKVTVTGMTVTDEPAVSSKGWRGWNLRTIGDAADNEGRMFLGDGTLAGDVGYGLVSALNNSINDMRAGTDLERAASKYPAIWSPTFSSSDGARRSIGSVTFKARLYYANGVRETDEGGKVTVWGTTSTDDDPSSWVKVKEFAVTDSVFSNFTWAANGAAFTAVKLEVSAASAKTTKPTLDRVILDEITICEKVQPSIGFLYVRPFRTDLYDPVEIKNILSMDQQPLVGEAWGVQTKLIVSQMEGEIGDLEVYLTTYTGDKPWGYGKWKTSGSKPVKLTPIGEATNLVFRSVGTNPDAIVKPIAEPNTVVQYMLVVKYSQQSEGGQETGEQPVETWEQPAWYAPVDYNRDNGGYADPSKFSPYTILDTVSPGRAWINEVNWNDGPFEETKTSSAVISNQFIEICVPSGVDMSGWYLRATDLNFNTWDMAMFGQQLPARKVSTHATNGFEFVVLESPETNYRGGIRDPDGNLAADGTWGSDGPSGSATGGTLNYSYPFQLELIRPSGVVEHQIILQGTNEWTEYSFGSKYYGTNLLERLNEQEYSAKRFYAGEETSTRKSGAWLGSAGVIGGSDDGNPAPGADGTWTSGLTFTAGRLNEGQIIPENWFIAPSGTNAWVYLYLNGIHLLQNAGGDTNRVAMMIVPEGVRTNVTYTAEPWYEVASVATKDSAGTRTEETHERGTWKYWFSPTGSVTITANEGVDKGLEKFNIGFREGDSVYSRAVINWLHDEYPDATPDDIRLARYKNLNYTDVSTNLTLTEMYWFDIPPVNSEGNASEESEWWLRGGFTEIRPQEYLRKSYNGVINTNNQFDVKLYISNDWDKVTVYAPKRLQGLNNEKSDTYAGAWTSVTFKISGMLLNGEEGNKGFLPFRMFTFGPDSFTPVTDPNPFTATIEVLDPFSTGSPGYSYGWSKYPNTTPFFFKWAVDTKEAPDTVQVLKSNDVYQDVP